MVAVPDEIPDTIPIVFTVATEVLDENHVPPEGLQDNIDVAPTHNDVTPVMPPTAPATVTIFVILQPAADV